MPGWRQVLCGLHEGHAGQPPCAVGVLSKQASASVLEGVRGALLCVPALSLVHFDGTCVVCFALLPVACRNHMQDSWVSMDVARLCGRHCWLWWV